MINPAVSNFKKTLNRILFVLLIFLIWRALLFGAELIGINILKFDFSFPYGNGLLDHSGLPQWLWQWVNFDGVHYLVIAKVGYSGFGTQVFFPFYPILISLLSQIVGNLIISGLIISHIAIFLSAVLLYHFVEKQFNSKAAKWSIIFLFAFPTSFFFAGFYTESLILLLILLSFQTKGILAGAVSGLASGTKLIGAFVAPILFIFKPRNYWAVIGETGLLAYMVYLWFKFDHRPLLFLTAQSAFKNNRASDITHLVLPPQVVFRYLKIFITTSPHNFDFWVALLEFSAFALGIIILGIMTYKKTLSGKILIFSWAALLLPSFSGSLSSMPRYLLPIFPIFIFLAKIKNDWLKGLILILSTLLLMTLTALFTRGYFIS